MSRGRPLGLAIAAAVAVSAAGCGDGGSSPPPRVDRPAKPPAGWRTVANRRAAFTIAAPKSWTARVRGAATLIRSGDGLVAVTVAADRSAPGRELPVSQYARETLQDLPDFDGSLSARTAHVHGSPYRSAVVQGAGRVRASQRLQRITVAALRVPRRATYTVVAFRNARVPGGFAGSTLRRMLRSLRAGVPG
jgi:hypothetical protein